MQKKKKNPLKKIQTPIWISVKKSEVYQTIESWVLKNTKVIKIKEMKNIWDVAMNNHHDFLIYYR